MKRHAPPPSSDPTNGLQPLLTSRETAEVLGVTDRTLRTLVRTGSLLAVRFGRSVRFDPADLRKFIDEAKRATDGGDR